MAKQSKPKQYQSPIKGVNDEGGKLRNSLPKAQMPPTPAEPLRQRYKMAGGC